MVHIPLFFFLYPIVKDIFEYIGYAIYVIQILSHFFAAIQNPGIPKRSNHLSAKIWENLKWIKGTYGVAYLQGKHISCLDCSLYLRKDSNVSHCKYCGICAEGKI